MTLPSKQGGVTSLLQLYGNAIELEGYGRARRNQRTTTSDWKEMERERGISISSTVLQFPYQGKIINLLDTPGHQAARSLKAQNTPKTPAEWCGLSLFLKCW